jgi:hypothetical protein
MQGSTNLSGGSGQKVINFLVDLLGTLEVLDTTHLRLNQVVTVNGSWHRCSVHASRHELQQSHLRNNDVSYIQNGRRVVFDKPKGRKDERSRKSKVTDLRCRILAGYSL